MDTENRLVGANLQGDEELIERSIRPKRFEDYVGQTNVTENLKVYIQASKMRKEPQSISRPSKKLWIGVAILPKKKDLK